MNNNKIREQSKMILQRSANGKVFGLISLKHLAKPESITVYLNDCFVTPEGFDIYGQPIISEEMCMFFACKYHETIQKYPDFFNSEVPAVVVYEPDIFSVPKSDFDSIEGIVRSLENLETFNQMLINRKRYLKSLTKEPVSLQEYIKSKHLDEFVIWKRFILDRFSNIFRIETDIQIPFIPDVCDLEFFNFRTENINYAYGSAIIPSAGSVCPICGSKFTTLDLQSRGITQINNKNCHDNCKEEYLRLQKKFHFFFI